MAVDPANHPPAPSRLTIGTVCKMLNDEFGGDVSISKIRFLEDQKLITPRRTPGGYRLYSQEDVEQLRTILRMQRDEFLPLRVIRQVMSQGGGGTRRPRIVNPDEGLSLDQLLTETDADQQFVRELHDFGLLESSSRDKSKPYSARTPRS